METGLAIEIERPTVDVGTEKSIEVAHANESANSENIEFLAMMAGVELDCGGNAEQDGGEDEDE